MRLVVLAAMVIAGIPTMPLLAHAAQVDNCDEVGRAAYIVEPWEKNSKTFYNGQVRVAYIDTAGEPVCCSGYLLVLAPDRETGDRACYIIGKTKGVGFASVSFEALTAAYDPRKGLLIAAPFTTLRNDGQTMDRGTIRVRVNVSTGKVIAE